MVSHGDHGSGQANNGCSWHTWKKHWENPKGLNSTRVLWAIQVLHFLDFMMHSSSFFKSWYVSVSVIQLQVIKPSIGIGKERIQESLNDILQELMTMCQLFCLCHSIQYLSFLEKSDCMFISLFCCGQWRWIPIWPSMQLMPTFGTTVRLHWTTWTEMKSVVTQRELRMLFRKRRKDISLLYKLKQHVSSIEATLQSGELSQNQTNVIPLTGITFNSLDACTDWCLKGTI